MPNSGAIDISIVMDSCPWLFDRNFDIIPEDIKEYLNSFYGNWLGYYKAQDNFEYLIENKTASLICKWKDNKIIFCHDENMIDEITYRKLMLVS